MKILRGDALELLGSGTETYDLVATDPPYAFGESSEEHQVTATVAVVLRETAKRVARDGWMLVMCASSWRSQAFMVDSVRGILQPFRVGVWCKPQPKTKVAAAGWQWQTVSVLAFRSQRSRKLNAAGFADFVVAAPLAGGRRAALPQEVADWMVRPFALRGGSMLDPFAGSGALCRAAEAAGMSALGFERQDQ